MSEDRRFIESETVAPEYEVRDGVTVLRLVYRVTLKPSAFVYAQKIVEVMQETVTNQLAVSYVEPILTVRTVDGMKCSSKDVAMEFIKTGRKRLLSGIRVSIRRSINWQRVGNE